LRPTTRSKYRVTIFGSARVPRDHWVYQAVRDLAAELTRLDCVIVTGGGPGLMQAANEGVHVANPGAASGSMGIRVDLPFEQDVNAFVTRRSSTRRSSRGSTTSCSCRTRSWSCRVASAACSN
jgi:predicted Rossmann-fold nucleotide-binding protein